MRMNLSRRYYKISSILVGIWVLSVSNKAWLFDLLALASSVLHAEQALLPYRTRGHGEGGRGGT